MDLHLNYKPAPSAVKITHADKILLIGSCFAENIGEKLLENKFQTLVNPNGILFNPASISSALRSYVKNDLEIKGGNKNGLTFSFEHHGSFSKTNNQEFVETVLNARKQAHDTLRKAKFLIITFGSAFAYRHLNTNLIVANCHKLPQQEFKKELLQVEDIVADYKLLFEELKNFNPQLNIIPTISPVKYLRDGIVENNISKATLLLATNRLLTVNSQPSTLNYFPAYELVTDDLRDYRFYKEDMAHPNEQAINYVWEKFSESYFNSETKNINQKIKEVNQAVNHRPLKPDTAKHSEFKNTVLKKCSELETTYPYLNFSEEKKQLINQ